MWGKNLSKFKHVFEYRINKYYWWNSSQLSPSLLWPSLHKLWSSMTAPISKPPPQLSPATVQPLQLPLSSQHRSQHLNLFLSPPSQCRSMQPPPLMELLLPLQANPRMMNNNQKSLLLNNLRLDLTPPLPNSPPLLKLQLLFLLLSLLLVQLIKLKPLQPLKLPPNQLLNQLFSQLFNQLQSNPLLTDGPIKIKINLANGKRKWFQSLFLVFKQILKQH